jgi:hypothetical protein
MAMFKEDALHRLAIARNSYAGAPGSPGRARRQGRAVVCVATILCLAALLCGSAEAVARRDASGGAALPAAKAAATTDFAIADFDGDALPDVATVQAGLVVASQTNYWIHFAFSAGNERSVSVFAPTGGLQISSRDVNGDSFLDVVVSTRLANQPVAVLLNDGRGNFRLADVRGFPAAIWETRTEWRGKCARVDDSDAAMASAGWSAGVLLFAAKFAEWPPAAEELAGPRGRRTSRHVAEGIRGRAPPQV